MGLAQMMRRSLTTTRPSCEQRPVGHALAKDLVFAVVAHGGGAQLVNLVDGTMGAFSGTTKPTWAGPFLSVPGGASTVSWVDWGASKQALTRDLALGPFSILARIYYRGSGSGGFLERSDGNTVNAGWEVGLSATAFGLVFVRASSDLYAFMPALPSNAWINVAICYPGTLVATDVKFYVNGAVQAHSADQTGSGAQGSDFANPMTVGRSSFAQAGIGAGTFNGLIDSIMILRRYLRAEEVRAWTVDPYLSFRQRRGRGLGLDVSPPATGITGSQKAYTYALGGVMRGGSSRGNYTSPVTFVQINGVQYAANRATPDQQVDNDTLSIVENDGDTPNRCSFAVRGFTPEDGQEIVITQGSINNLDRLFAGTILTDISGYVGTPANTHDQVSAIDYTWQLTRATITRRWTNKSATVIAQEIIADAGRGFTSLRVEAGLPVVDEFTVTSQTHIQALKNLADRVGATLKPTYTRDVRFGISADPQQTDPTPITAASALLTEMTDFRVTRDLSQAISRQPVEGGGSNAATTVVAGETILPLENAVWYNALGGLVASGPQHLQYAGVQHGGAGSVAGPSAAPVTAAFATATNGTGIDDGTHDYAYTWVTASGETLPSPVVSVSTGVVPTTTGTPSATFVANPFFPVYGGGPITAGTVIDYALSLNPPGAVSGGPLGPIGSITAPGTAGYIAVSFTVTADMVGYYVLCARRDNGGSWYANNVSSVITAGQVGTVITFNDIYRTALDFGGGSGTVFTPDANLKQVNVSGIAIGPAGTTARKIYRTAAGAAQLKLLTTLANNTTTAYVDATADSSLGANAPTSDTSLLSTTTGQILAGSTSILTAGAGPFAATGGWLRTGEQFIRYTGISGNTLTGIPPSGPGALVTTIAYGEHLDTVPALTGIPATGTGAILYTINAGDAVNLRIVEDDLDSQATIAAAIGGGDDGIIEGALIQDGRISETEARARAVAQLELKKPLEVGVGYTTRDINTKAGATIAVNLTTPACVGSFRLRSVTISNFAPARWPTRQAGASSTRFTLEDLLRLAREKTR